jgi:hypothetical protein
MTDTADATLFHDLTLELPDGSTTTAARYVLAERSGLFKNLLCDVALKRGADDMFKMKAPFPFDSDLVREALQSLHTYDVTLADLRRFDAVFDYLDAPFPVGFSAYDILAASPEDLAFFVCRTPAPDESQLSIAMATGADLGMYLTFLEFLIPGLPGCPAEADVRQHARRFLWLAMRTDAAWQKAVTNMTPARYEALRLAFPPAVITSMARRWGAAKFDPPASVLTFFDSYAVALTTADASAESLAVDSDDGGFVSTYLAVSGRAPKGKTTTCSGLPITLAITRPNADTPAGKVTVNAKRRRGDRGSACSAFVFTSGVMHPITEPFFFSYAHSDFAMLIHLSE